MTMKEILPLALLLGAGPVLADGYSGSVAAGVGIQFREKLDEPPFDVFTLEYEDGLALKLEGMLQGAAPWRVRGRYTHTTFGELSGPGGLTVAEDLLQQEVQAGLFYIPQGTGSVGYHLGGGYEYIDDEPVITRGLFLEAGASTRVLGALSLQFTAAWMPLDKGNDGDRVDRVEFLLAGSAPVGPVEIMLQARQFSNRGERGPDDGGLEFSLLAGARWGAAAQSP